MPAFVNKLLIVLWMAASLLAMAPAAEQEATTPTLTAKLPRVGFVDVELVLDSSRAVRQIMTQLDKDLADESGKIDERQREVRQIRMSLDQQGSVLSEAERQERQQRALDLLAKIDEMKFHYQQNMQVAQRTTIEPLLEQVIGMIADVGEREGYDLVVRGEMVLYGRGTVDLTPLVVRELDSRAAELRAALLPKSKAEPTPAVAEPLPLIP